MKTHVITVLSLCLFLLVGCQQSVDDLVVNENYPISIEANIGGASGSRYSGSTPNTAEFVNGDEIGLAYQVGEDAATNFVKWILTESGWEQNGSSMTWENKNEEHAFYAFYPYGNNDANTTLEQVKMPLLTNQDGTMSSVAACDFLVAKKNMIYANDGKVSFTGDDAFKHISSLIILTLKNSDDLASATIKKISLEGTDLVANSNYSFIGGDDGNVSLEEGNNDDVMIANFENGFKMNGNSVFYFVVNSGTINLSNVKLSITYKSAGGDVYTVTKQGLNQENSDGKFKRGFFYNYGIKVMTDKSLLISGYEIDEWDEDVSFDITIDNSQKQNQNS